MVRFRWLLGLALVGTATTGCTSGDQGVTPEDVAAGEPAIDVRSYRLGGMGAFAEMVGAGVKDLALSSPMTAMEVDGLLAEAHRIAAENGAEIYREADFLVTDLFSSDLTDGLEVLLIFKGNTLDRYLEIKQDKESLVGAGSYHGEARLEIARRFGSLLSYPDSRIEELLRGGVDGS